MCRRFRGVWGWFEAWDEVVVVVVDVVGVVDGGCAAVVSSNVAAFTGTGAVGAGGSRQACDAMSQVLGSSVDVPASFNRYSSTSVAVCIAASTVRVVVVWEAVSAVMGATWVPASVVF
jgi:hypothetical protein